MGICASIQSTKNRPKLKITNGTSPSTIKVINSVDGNMQEFQQPIKGHQVLSDHPNTFFLCNSEEMFVNHHVPHVAGDEELQPGQIYLLIPISESNKLLSLHELCLYAIKASKAIEKSRKTRTNDETVSSSDRRRRNRNGNGNGNHKVDFQLALERLE